MKPRVLIFIDWFSPGYKAGGPTTSNVNIVDHLSDTFDFYIITSDKDYHATSPYRGIDTDCWVGRGNCKVWYCSEGKNSLADLKNAAASSGAEVWYITGVYSLRFSILPLVLAKMLRPAKVIVAPRGMLSSQTFTVKPRRKKLFLWGISHSGLLSQVHFHGTNDEECRAIRKEISKKAKCSAIPNLPRKGNVDFVPSHKPSGTIRLVSFARISPEKNTLFALDALNLCKTKVAFDLFGQINDADYWAACELIGNRLPENITVRYRGTASPHEIPALYRNYDALYLPTTGENFGHAILESFVNGRPAIISDRTPWHNLADSGIGFDIPLSNSSDFAEAIDNLASTSSSDFDTMCKQSYEFALQVCNDENIKRKYIELFTSND